MERRTRSDEPNIFENHNYLWNSQRNMVRWEYSFKWRWVIPSLDLQVSQTGLAVFATECMLISQTKAQNCGHTVLWRLMEHATILFFGGFIWNPSKNLSMKLKVYRITVVAKRSLWVLYYPSLHPWAAMALLVLCNLQAMMGFTFSRKKARQGKPYSHPQKGIVILAIIIFLQS